MQMYAGRSRVSRGARIRSFCRSWSTAAALVVLLAVLFTSGPRSGAPGAVATVIAGAIDAGGAEAGRAGASHQIDTRLIGSNATPLRPDLTARSLLSGLQPALRRAWETHSDAAPELRLPARLSADMRSALLATAFLHHSPQLLRRKTGSISSMTTSLPPPVLIHSI